uniref:Reverse transcriptase domain-containing protein n=1 Tax=Tanacetum cinerariifolium TaxID=118510 RepID=A0A699GQ91_TANCI|nr:reverse transcriptase domain-containing protein [Tanacetum cinerariifolium]
MATNGNGDNQPPPEEGELPVFDLRTMEELCQPTLNGRDTFYNGLTLRHRDTINAVVDETFMKKRPKECYNLIENMSAHHNDWDTSAQRSESSSCIISSSDPEILALKAEMAEIIINLMKVLQINQQVKALTPNCKTYGGPHSYNDCPATVGQTQNVYTAGAYNQGGTLPSNTITNPEEDLKGITTRSGIAYKGPTIPTSYSPPKVVECKTEVTKDTVPPTNNGSTKDVQPLVVQVETQVPNSEPVVAPIVKPVEALVSASKPNPKPSIPYPSRLNDQKLREKSLLTNKEKLFELAITLLNEHCSAVLLKKLPEKLRDPDKFLIPCNFPGMDKCLALADLSTSINLMLLSIWNKLSLLKLYPTCMTLELADRLISRSVGIAEDVSVKVGKFHFSADFVVIDFDADSRVTNSQKILLKIERALIDVYEGELTLFNQIDVIHVAYEEYSQEVLGFSGDILFLEEFLNDDPSSPPLPLQELKLNDATRKDHFPLPFMDQIPIDPQDQEKTTFMCPYGTFAYRRMPFGLCNAPSTFQRCMMAIFHNMIKKTMEVFMDDFSIFRNSFGTCLSHLDKMLKRCEDTNLCLNWEKSHFMVKEGIVLGHKISKNGIEVDKAKVDVIAKLPHPTTVKGIRSFLGHDDFYRQFIQDFSKIAWPTTRLLKKDTLFIFSKECIEAFQSLKKKLTEAPILVAPDWDLPFELMCDASDFAIGAVLGK